MPRTLIVEEPRVDQVAHTLRPHDDEKPIERFPSGSRDSLGGRVSVVSVPSFLLGEREAGIESATRRKSFFADPLQSWAIGRSPRARARRRPATFLEVPEAVVARARRAEEDNAARRAELLREREGVVEARRLDDGLARDRVERLGDERAILGPVTPVQTTAWARRAASRARRAKSEPFSEPPRRITTGEYRSSRARPSPPRASSRSSRSRSAAEGVRATVSRRCGKGSKVRAPARSRAGSSRGDAPPRRERGVLPGCARRGREEPARDIVRRHGDGGELRRLRAHERLDLAARREDHGARSLP